jgi:hypothetical protein
MNIIWAFIPILKGSIILYLILILTVPEFSQLCLPLKFLFFDWQRLQTLVKLPFSLQKLLLLVFQELLFFITMLLPFANFVFSFHNLMLLLFQKLIVELLFLLKPLLSQPDTHEGQVYKIINRGSSFLF